MICFKKIYLYLALITIVLTKYCKNHLDKFVDWYVIFIIPKSERKNKSIIYYYFDNNLETFTDYIFQNNTFPPNKILDYVIIDDFMTNYIIWNDDKTILNTKRESSGKNKAHSKGMLIYDSDSGVFFSHSIPKYPIRDINNNVLKIFPDNSDKYGQSMLCISLSKDESEEIIKILRYININVVKIVSSDRVNTFPNLSLFNIIMNEKLINDEIDNLIKINSLDFEKFYFIVKNHKKEVIPYDTTLRFIFKDDFFVRTWSKPKLSVAENYKNLFIKNIYKVKIGKYYIPINKDHSKWAIAKNKNIICFSDLNHVISQKSRGGMIICFENKNLHKFLNDCIIETE
jgi:hypothetical protein